MEQPPNQPLPPFNQYPPQQTPPFNQYPQQPSQGYMPPPQYQQPFLSQPQLPKKQSLWEQYRALPKRFQIIIASAVIFLAMAMCEGVIQSVTTNTSNSTNTQDAAAVVTDTPVPTDTPAPTDTPTSAPSLAYQLASIDMNGSVASNDASIAKYQALLDVLHRKTGDSEQTISDETVAGRDLVKTKYGKDVTLLELLQNVDQSLPDGAKIHYSDALAAYITLVYS